MNKFSKLALGVVAVSVATATVVASGCAPAETKGEAYGLVHGAGYVAAATVVVKDNAVTAATLVEVCFPNYVQAPETVAAEDKVVATVLDHGSEVEKTFYKTISYGSVTYTYDAEKADYVSGGKTFKELMATEANAKAYYEAVVNNAISVTVGGQAKTDIMNNATLNKEVNGYWTAKADIDGDKDKDKNDSSWKYNRDETIEYLLENGIDSLLGLTKSTTKSEVTGGTIWANGELTTGATWTDLNSDTTGKGYFSYAQLFEKAINATK